MKHTFIIVIILSLILACEKDSTGPEETVPGISLAVPNSEIEVGQKTNVKVNLDLKGHSIFGVSMGINYLPYLVTFDDPTDFMPGDYFGGKEISFIKKYENSIHLTFSLTQGQAKVNGVGNLAVFRFTGANKGLGYIEIIPEQLHFYDTDGSEITIPDIKINDLKILVE